MTNNTALQVTDFNFYGDNLIVLKNNVTGEVYVTINSVLRGIGFTKDSQLQYQRKRWIQDNSVSKLVFKFNILSNGGNQLTQCISIRKLSLALAKINITKRLKRDYPDIIVKLEFYQGKCADVLTSVFVDHKVETQIILQPILDALESLTRSVNESIISINKRIDKLEEEQSKAQKPSTKKKFSCWQSRMFPKYKLLMDYFGISKNGDLYRQLYKEFHNIHPEIELNHLIDDYCSENNLDSCFTLDAIEYDKDVRKLFEDMVNSLLRRYGLFQANALIKEETIFSC